MSRWFRHYAGMMRDEKLVRAAVKAKQPVERVVWVWGAILESAAEINDGGRYEFDAGEASYFLRCDGDEIGAVLAELENAGRLSNGIVARWGDRQFSSDAGAERQRRYRERRNRNGDGSEPQTDRNSDGDVTSRNGEVTPQETETDTYPVASATDAASPVDVRSALWSEGVSILTSIAGTPERTAKSLVGKWLRDNRDDCALVLSKIRQAKADRMGEPISWITAALKPPDKPPKKLTQGESIRNMARAAGVIDDTGNPVRRLETSNRNGENPGVGDALRLAVSGNHGW